MDNLDGISIIIPMFNARNTISNTLASVINQTDTKWEIIIIDDGSVDDSYSLAMGLLDKQNNPFQIIRTENNGQSIARDLGLNRAIYEWVLFLDSDDTLELSFFERFRKLKSSQTTSSEVYFFDYKIIYEDNQYIASNDKFLGLTNQKGIELVKSYYLGMGASLGTSNLLYSNVFLKSNGIKFYIIDNLYEHQIKAKYLAGEDIIFPLISFLYADRVSYFPIFSVNYSQHGNNYSYKFNVSRLGAFYSNYYLVNLLKAETNRSRDLSRVCIVLTQGMLNGFLYNLVILRYFYFRTNSSKLSYRDLINVVQDSFPMIFSTYNKSLRNIFTDITLRKSINYLVWILFIPFPEVTLLLLEFFFKLRGLKDDFGHGMI